MDTNSLTYMLIVGLLGGLMILFNVVLIFKIFSTRQKAEEAQTWPATIGTVVESELRMRRRGKRNIYYPHVVYTYSAGGQTHTGKRVNPGIESGGTTARNIIAKYPAGSQVKVHYNPQNPSDAALETDVSNSITRLWISLALVNLTLCACMAFPLFMFVRR